MSFRFSFQASLPQSIRLTAISLASKSILPWVLPLAGFRADLSPQRRGHDPATITSLRLRHSILRRARSLSAHGFNGPSE